MSQLLRPFARGSLPRRILVCSLALMLPATATGDVVEHLPPGALGFVMVSDLKEASDDIEALMTMFDAPLPSPLAFFKLSTGFDEGLHANGDLLFALMPSEQAGREPGPLALIPVSDYEAFAQALGGDPSGEIAPVQVAGEDVLLAKKGDYALLMNPEHRRSMESLVRAAPVVPEPLAGLESWLAENDAAIVLLPAGVRLLSGMAQAELGTARRDMEEGFAELDMEEELQAMRAMFAVYERLLKAVEEQVEVLAYGVSVDAGKNLRMGLRVAVAPGGRLARAADLEGGIDQAIAGLPAEPLLGALGGPWPESFSDAASQLSIDFMRGFPELYGLGSADESDLRTLEESVTKSFAGIRGFAMSMSPGEVDDPLISNIVFLINVQDTEAYLQAYEESAQLWNQIVAKAESGDRVTYHTTREEIAGQSGLRIDIDFSDMVSEQELPAIELVMEKFFGTDGKMIAYLAVIDQHRLLGGILKKEVLEQRIASLRAQEPDLAQNESLRATAQLLDREAAWVAYLSPKGAVDWFRRAVEAVTAAIGGGPLIPQFPETPPIGFSLKLRAQQLEADVVVPAATLEGLSEYVQEARR